MIIEEGFDLFINDMNYGNDSKNLTKFKEKGSVEVKLGRIFITQNLMRPSTFITHLTF
jgi:hypothetical protein